MPVCATRTQCRPIDDIVADLDEIVDLGALADHGVADGAAVDGGAGADLHVVLDDDPADLRHLAVAPGPHHEAEAVLPDAQPGWMITRSPIRVWAIETFGPDRAVAADAHAWSDDGAGADHGPGADLGARSDHRARIDR